MYTLVNYQWWEELCFADVT